MNPSSKWFAAALGCALGGLAPLCYPAATSVICCGQVQNDNKGSRYHDAQIFAEQQRRNDKKTPPDDGIEKRAGERAVWLRKLQAELNPSFPRELTTTPMPIVADNKPINPQPTRALGVDVATNGRSDNDPTHTTFHPTHPTNLENPSAKTLEQTDFSSRKLLQALTKALGNHTPQVMRHANTHKDDILPNSTGSPFAVQVATFPSLALAKRLQQELARKGYSAAVVQNHSHSVHGETGKQIAYHVRLHGFTSWAEAEQYRLRFQRQQPRLTTFCVKQEP